MIAKLLPLLLAVFGLAAGAGAGLFLRPSGAPAEHGAAADHEAAADSHSDPAPAAADGHGEAAPKKPADDHAAEGDHGTKSAAAEGGEGHTSDYVKLNNQFVVPVVENGRVSALVVLSLSLEVTTGMTEAVYQIEPKLRDSFLQVLFDHANSGGFKGTFTDGSNLVLLRQALMEVAQRILGKDVTDVLIVDIVRQDS